VEILYIRLETIHGQPQCLKKAITVGFPFGLGKGNFEEVGAFDPISGTGDGVPFKFPHFQELSSV
jgi:hypothetical protein